MALPVVLHHTGYHLNQKQHWVALKDYYLPKLPSNPNPSPLGSASDVLNMLLTGHPVSADTSAHPAAARGIPWGSLCLLAVYFVSMFLATFFNVAFYSEIIAALNGRGVSFRRGLGVARSRLPSILAWSLLAGAGRMDHSQHRATVAVRRTNRDGAYRDGLERCGGVCNSRDHPGATHAQPDKNSPAIRADFEADLGRKSDWLCGISRREPGDGSVVDGAVAGGGAYCSLPVIVFGLQSLPA